MNKNDVFISYSRKDKEIAQEVCHFLEDNGVRCWLDHRDIVVGEKWAKAIVNAIRDSTVVIAILSEHYNNSLSSVNEIDLAESWKKPIIPIKIDNSNLSDELKFYLVKYLWIYASRDKEWQNNLIKTLKRYHVDSTNERCVSELNTSDSSLQDDIQIEDESNAVSS
jgi:hypothetical protein